MSRIRRTTVALVILVVISGCASVVRQADHLFEAGDYAPAAQAYEDYLHSMPERGPSRSRALYRLAVTYGSESQPPHDPGRSVELLEQLLAEDPQGDYFLAAEIMLESQREIVRLSAVVASRRDVIQTQIADLSRLQAELERTESEVGERNETVQVLLDRIERLRREIARLSNQLSDREAELEKLKEIDLEVPPF